MVDELAKVGSLEWAAEQAALFNQRIGRPFEIVIEDTNTYSHCGDSSRLGHGLCTVWNAMPNNVYCSFRCTKEEEASIYAGIKRSMSQPPALPPVPVNEPVMEPAGVA